MGATVKLAAIEIKQDNLVSHIRISRNQAAASHSGSPGWPPVTRIFSVCALFG